MPGILLNGLVTLRFPVLRVDPELGAFNTYLATWKNGAHEFALSIAQPVKHVNEPLLPHGTSADVDAFLTVHKRSLLLTATNVTGLFVATNNSIRSATSKLFQPVLNLAGKITQILPPDIRFPGVRVVEVTVENGGLWPYHATTVVAYFNRVDRRLRMLAPLDVGMSLSLSGELSGWVNGTIAMDVQDVSFNNNGDLPEGPLTTLPCLFERLKFSSDFAVFADPNKLPPLAGRPSSFANLNSSSSRWLETVAPLATRAAGTSAAPVDATAARLRTANEGRRISTAEGSSRNPQAVRRRRDTPRPSRRMPLAPLDANVREYETVAA